MDCYVSMINISLFFGLNQNLQFGEEIKLRLFVCNNKLSDFDTFGSEVYCKWLLILQALNVNLAIIEPSNIPPMQWSNLHIHSPAKY